MRRIASVTAKDTLKTHTQTTASRDYSSVCLLCDEVSTYDNITPAKRG